MYLDILSVIYVSILFKLHEYLMCAVHTHDIHICSLYSFHKEGKRLGFRRATKKEQRVKLLEATLLSTTMQSMMIMMMMLTENKRETIIFLYRIPRCTSVKSRRQRSNESVK